MPFVLEMSDASGKWYVTGEPEIEQFKWTPEREQATKFSSIKAVQDFARLINDRLPGAQAKVHDA